MKEVLRVEVGVKQFIKSGSWQYINFFFKKNTDIYYVFYLYISRLKNYLICKQ